MLALLRATAGSAREHAVSDREGYGRAVQEQIRATSCRLATKVHVVRISGICFAGTSTPQRRLMTEFVSEVLGLPRHHIEGVEADLFELPDGSSFAVASPGGMGDSARSLGLLVANLDEAVAELNPAGVATDAPAANENQRYVQFTAPDGHPYELVERL
jgi:glyoxylase I family protein